ncbi:ABC transporter ATP-binding protein/permease [Jeotgalibaca sp. MA1X17-3]|uniref:ABC transporter ATP-binding protein n=1 Tax=Jeotgalibaca sp. MA1X17-3 TaxID=2908211 RepID=UPI001F284C05|nr:ABC transporter ATP-binding protein [Jeotgalibaca sp. MA1X17-3]UJF15821.1 ABC transporter ATP-binding protein/permease [Jeotgalibaca sp. MA1X17-3]
MLKRFFYYYKPYKKLFMLDFTCAVIAAVLELAFPVAVKEVIDTILPVGNWNLIIFASIALFSLYALNTVFQFIVTYFGHMLGVNIETDMRQELFTHMQKQPFSYYDNNKTGKLMTRLTTDLFEISEVAHHGPEDIFITIITLLGAFALMTTVHVKLAIATVCMVPFIIFAISFFNKRMTKVNTKIFESLGEFNAGIEASVSGIRVVQAFANEEHEAERFKNLNQFYRKSKLLFYKMMGFSSSYNYFMIRLMNLFALFFGSYYTIRGELTNGDFVGFILLVNIFVRPIEKVNNMIEMYPKGIAGFRRFTEEMDRTPSIQNKANARHVQDLKGDIEYKDVSFWYEESEPVLDGINLSVHAGETIAFVGPSGAGKTTLCNLLPRFYEIKSGQITIDGMDIQDMKLESLRNEIGVVQQDVYLFPGTIRENILYGRLDATEEEVVAAAKMANLDHVISAMPKGFDTIIGERGVKLSGGQKQRLSIARMFLKNPPILILDEATSALDTETEQVIQESLHTLAAGRTTFIIAHRLATIKHATRIVVVDENGVSEQGTHTELMKNEGTYKRLYEAQFLQ